MAGSIPLLRALRFLQGAAIQKVAWIASTRKKHGFRNDRDRWIVVAHLYVIRFFQYRFFYKYPRLLIFVRYDVRQYEVFFCVDDV